MPSIEDVEGRVKYEKLKNNLFEKDFTKRSKALLDVIKDSGIFEEYLLYCSNHRK